MVRSNSLLCGFDVYNRAERRRLWNGMTVFAQAFNVKFDGLTNELEYLITRFAGGNTPGQVGYIGTERGRALLDDDKVLHGLPHFLSPACFSALFKVPGGMSTLGFPATVTVPGFVG